MKKFFLSIIFCTSALFAQTTIVSEGFNNSATLFTNTGGVYKTGNSTSSDAPASSPFAVEGSHSIGVNNGTLTLTSNTINTTGYTGIELVFRLASFSIGSTTNGADATDIVKVEISTDDGTSWTEILQVKGYSNAYWSYSGGTGTALVDYSNFTTSQTFQPSAGGARTTDGYSTVKITNLPATNQLKVRITAVNNSPNELWVIDDFKITDTPLPVELSLFTYKLVDGKVKLVWNTATELNNKGFYVEKNIGNSWITLGFVDGKGNSNISNSYEFTDNSQNFGTVSYRLKQVDNDGKFTYSHTIEVNATLPKDLTLLQNYPNPFNPTTTISYAIPTAGNVSVKVYNSLGQEVVTLFEGYQEAGMKQLNFNANNLNSGIYYCVVNFGNSTKVTKMMLMK
jgi:hypothetical protein